MMKCTAYIEQYMGELWTSQHCHLPHTGTDLSIRALLAVAAVLVGVALWKLARA